MLNKKKNKIFFRIDADSVIGLGHLSRCSTLGVQLQKDGFIVEFVMKKCFEFKSEKLAQFKVHFLSEVEFYTNDSSDKNQEVVDAQATLFLIKKSSNFNSVVVVDHYSLGEKWEKVVCEAGFKVVAFDDFRNREHHAHMLVSDIEIPFDIKLNKNKIFFGQFYGSKFSLVDKCFSFSKKVLPLAEKPKNILISYGGSDPTKETIKAINAILLLNERKKLIFDLVNVVIGHANNEAKYIESKVEKMKNIKLHFALSSIAPLMRLSNLILCAGGNTMIEALTMRQPCVVTQTAENQFLMINQLLKQNIIYYLGDHNDVNEEKMVEALLTINTDYHSLAKNCLGSDNFDSLGAARISQQIQKLGSFEKETFSI